MVTDESITDEVNELGIEDSAVDEDAVDGVVFASPVVKESEDENPIVKESEDGSTVYDSVELPVADLAEDDSIDKTLDDRTVGDWTEELPSNVEPVRVVGAEELNREPALEDVMDEDMGLTVLDDPSVDDEAAVEDLSVDLPLVENSDVNTGKC